MAKMAGACLQLHCAAINTLDVDSSHWHHTSFMDERTRNAICKWLDWPHDGSEVRRLRAEPLSVFAELINVLPPHLLQAGFQAPTTTCRQRGTLPAICERRREWASKAQPGILQLQEARHRDPLLYRQIVAQRSNEGVSSIIQPSSKTKASSNDALTHPDDVATKPRFAALLQRYDDEESAQMLAREDHFSASGVNGEGEEFYDEDEDVLNNADQNSYAEESTHDDDVALFLQAVLARFIRGDEELGEEMYSCDFDDQWDTSAFDTSEQESKGTLDTDALNKRFSSRHLNPGIREQDAWFDDEEPS